MENQDKVTDIKDVKWTTWYLIGMVVSFLGFFFTSEAEGVEMLGALFLSIGKAIIWPLSIAYSLFT